MTNSEYEAQETNLKNEIAGCKEAMRLADNPKDENDAAQRRVYLTKELYALHDNYEFLVKE